jgi:hypothetical protein
MHGAPAYLAEMCPSEICIGQGECHCRWYGAWICGWKLDVLRSSLLGRLVVACALLSLPMLLLTYYIPRSTRWLLLHGHKEEAYHSMTFIYRGDFRENFETLVSKVTVSSPLMKSKSKICWIQDTAKHWLQAWH